MQLTHDSVDLGVHIVEAFFAAGGFYYLRRIARLVSVSREFPPHLHVKGGIIIYPQDFPPPELARLNGEAKP